jgi:AcrR family transcriptional regulator
MTTKERILKTATDLFAEKGYSDVSIREITRAVGIKESSLYNHFASKQQILDEIFETLKHGLDASTAPPEAAAEMVLDLTPEAFVEMSVGIFESYLGNPEFVKIWRIVSMERFKNERARDLFNRHFVDEPMEYQARVFAALMDAGRMPRRDPNVLAREFFSFILFLYVRYIETDRDVRVSNNPEFQKMVREHMEFLGFAFGGRSNI